MISETLWGLPTTFLTKLNPVDGKKVKNWNHQLFLYCQRKNLNPFDYFFDELGLIIATMAIGSDLYKDYSQKYGHSEDKKKEENKLSAEWEHINKLAEDKQKDIESGKLVI